MRCLLLLAMLGHGALISVETHGATASFRTERYAAPMEAVVDGVPAGALVHDFFVTTDADILSIGQVDIQGVELWNVEPPFGSDSSFPAVDFISLIPASLADSVITTPGSTSILGMGFPGGGTSTWGDLSNDGAVTNFLFARLTTLPGKRGFFNGRVSLAGSTGPEGFPFSFPIGVPEPASVALLGLCLSGVFLGRGFRPRVSAA